MKVSAAALPLLALFAQQAIAIVIPMSNDVAGELAARRQQDGRQQGGQGQVSFVLFRFRRALSCFMCRAGLVRVDLETPATRGATLGPTLVETLAVTREALRAVTKVATPALP